MNNYLIRTNIPNNNNNTIIILLIFQQLGFISFVIYMVITIDNIKEKVDNEINYIDIIKNNSFLENKTLTDEYINKTKSIINY